MLDKTKMVVWINQDIEASRVHNEPERENAMSELLVKIAQGDFDIDRESKEVDFPIRGVANTLIAQSVLHGCSLKSAWVDYMHPLIVQQFAFEQVHEFIKERIAQDEHSKKVAE